MILVDRVIATLKFFDLQDIPVTLFELHRFLLADIFDLKANLNANWDLTVEHTGEKVSIDQVLKCLETDCSLEVECKYGYYALRGRGQIIESRWSNYLYGFKRERLVRRYIWVLSHIPFVRGVAIGGSQAMGQQKQGSDIDLLIITENGFMWLTRTLVSAYFQFLGMRRHGKFVANRFCLNHYLARPKIVDREKNLYKAMEYGRLRPVIYEQNILIFLQQNYGWISSFFPNMSPPLACRKRQSLLQKTGEWLLGGRFGRWLEEKLKNIELPRIAQDQYTFVLDDELSFHPGSRHSELLKKFFQA